MSGSGESERARLGRFGGNQARQKTEPSYKGFWDKANLNDHIEYLRALSNKALSYPTENWEDLLSESVALAEKAVMNADSFVKRLAKVGNEHGVDLLAGVKATDIKGLSDVRNFPAHDYMNVDRDYLFDTLTKDLPRVLDAIQKNIAELL